MTDRPGHHVTGDTLSDVLRAVRLGGALFYYLEGTSPWVAEAPAASESIPAEESAMSRSMLHERFVQFTGQAPMQYPTQWRMQVAAGLLRDTQAKLLDVALEVGYESEAAFSRAFKRIVGVAPGVWRRGQIRHDTSESR